ncbi:MAG: YcbK family protein [Methylovulum sp.]|nr:YcbK family protein [Methylovulum sp.]
MALLSLGCPEMVSAAVRHTYTSTRPHTPAHKIIALENINTGDKLKLAYFEQGRYVKEALQEINYLFRDFHSGDVHPIDPSLLDQLYDLKQNLDVTRPVHIISGYRSPVTNAQLRKQSHKVAKHSLHMEGRAIDIRIEGVKTKHIRNAAIAMQRGGVGYYPRANFVHLDTGEIRTW